MGYGEKYSMEFYEWKTHLDDETWETYKAFFPEPIGWLGWYKGNVEKYEYTYHLNWLKEKEHDNEFLFFWGHQPAKNGELSKSCLSQWWQSSFKEGHRTFCCEEQYMMAYKARLFGDDHAEEKIMKSVDPKEIKTIGRTVKRFDESIWNEQKYSTVVMGNYHKFMQNDEMKKFLLNTGDKIMVEASPTNKIWGIGLSADDPKAKEVCSWRGQNLLGFALMEVRDIIRKACENEAFLDV
jgi:ribA/ribD-fused uncharacterized protein